MLNLIHISGIISTQLWDFHTLLNYDLLIFVEDFYISVHERYWSIVLFSYNFFI